MKPGCETSPMSWQVMQSLEVPCSTFFFLTLCMSGCFSERHHDHVQVMFRLRLKCYTILAGIHDTAEREWALVKRSTRASAASSSLSSVNRSCRPVLCGTVVPSLNGWRTKSLSTRRSSDTLARFDPHLR